MTFQGQARERTFEQVKAFWEETAQKFQLDPRGTIRDSYFQRLEIEEISKRIRGRKKALDVGCGNGFATIHYSQEVESIIGVDYCEQFISWARELLNRELSSGRETSRKDNLAFQVADIQNLPFAPETFDTVICERVLINLPEREKQEKSLRELWRVLQKDGLLICLEVTKQGHEGVNVHRSKFGLPPLEQYWHNLYLDEPSFLAFAEKYFQVQAIKRFGVYQFISKVLHPRLVAPQEPKFEAKINEIAYRLSQEIPEEEIPEMKDCGHQVMFVLQKIS